MPIRKEKLTTELKQIAVYDENRVVLLIQNLHTSNNVYITDRPKDEADTPYFLLAPRESIVFMRELGDEPQIAYYAKADGDTDITIIESFKRGE